MDELLCPLLSLPLAVKQVEMPDDSTLTGGG
jgi:hypothetical protein